MRYILFFFITFLTISVSKFSSALESIKLESIVLKGVDRSAIMNDGILTVNILAGVNAVMQYRSDDLLSACMSNVNLVAEFEFSENYEFATHVEKLPLGIYGGKGNCVSGGCPVTERDGFSIRLIERSGDLGLYIYDQVTGVSGKGYDYGRSIYSDFNIQSKNIYQIHVGIEKSGDNNSAILAVNGNVLLTTPIYIGSEYLCAKGVLMTFMWGGDSRRKIHWAPREQSFTMREVILNAYE
jgi:hypothetical protein